jgi:hypothetical protein
VVEAERVATIERQLGSIGIDRGHAALAQLDVVPGEMVCITPQVGAGLVDVAFEEVGDCHAPIRRFRLVAKQDDGGLRVGLAQGVGCDHAGGAVADDDVLHDRLLGYGGWKREAPARSGGGRLQRPMWITARGA